MPRWLAAVIAALPPLLVAAVLILPVGAVAQQATPATTEERLEAREVWVRQLLLQRLQSEEQCSTEIARLVRENRALREQVQKLTPKEAPK